MKMCPPREWPEGTAREVINGLVSEFTRAHTGDPDAWRPFDERGRPNCKWRAKIVLGVKNESLLFNITGVCQRGYGGVRAPYLGGLLGVDRIAPFLRQLLARTTPVKCFLTQLKEGDCYKKRMISYVE